MTRPLLAAVLLHVVVAAALLAVGLSRPVRKPALRSIDVQLVSPAQLVPAQAPITPPARLEPTPPAARIEQPSAPPSEQVPEPPAGMPPPTGGLVQAQQLYAGQILAEPASREVRDTLPLLEPQERLTQLCNIEALQQLRLAQAGSDPDAMSDAAFGETEIQGLTLHASGAAYRSRRNWFGVEFECTVSSDFAAVTDFKFRVGGAIPQELWEDHDLIAEDEDE